MPSIEEAEAAACERAAPYYLNFTSKSAGKSAALPSGLQLRSGGWASSILKQLKLEGTGVVDRICRRWASYAEDFASDHVREAFSPLREGLQSFAEGKKHGDVIPMVLALAGEDSEDHEATMCQVELMIRDELPKACTALVGPSELRSMSYANRRICGQFLRSEGSNARVETLDEDPEEEEEVVETPGMVSAADFADWHQAGRKGPVVLVIQATDAVAKDVLRDVLCFWSAQGLPLLLVLGLKQLPSSRWALFEGEPLRFKHLATLRLFSAEAVCNQLLEKLAEDAACPFALCPDVLKKLRESFINKRQSVSYILRSLILFCDEALSGSDWAPLCAPLRAQCQSCPELDQIREQLFESLQKSSPKQQKALLQRIATTLTDAPGTLHAVDIKERGVRAAAEAVTWRWKVIDSLKVWEALFIAADPLTKHTARLRRLHKLLEVLWPMAGESEEQQGSKLEMIYRPLMLRLDCLERSKLSELLTELGGDASACLGSTLREDMRSLASKAMQPEESSGRSSDDELRAGLRTWVESIRAQHWQPLTGPPRQFLVAEGAFSGSQASLEAVDNCLNRSAEVQQKQIAEADGDLKDAATLYRLLECHSGKQTKVVDLWSAFLRIESSLPEIEVKSRGSKRQSEEEEIRKKFKLGLMSLHQLGIFSPAAGTSQRGMSGWRLRKRLFGRVWLRRLQPPDWAEAVAIPEEPETPSASSGSLSQQPVDLDVDSDSPMKTARPPRAELEPSSWGSRLKRLPFPRQSAALSPPEEKFERPNKKAKIFLGH
mmetsp:Transcript_70913/g.125315  ORF Transcript_70913/g.125315 Transcript_70913/m.125315 type:complete len:776 (-) Transcript_70913:85-2412(-)|eukprot:CAMPEP_0197635708 /NCGR_PEP_ID=MMETSP1338-20131121/11440_1 /TAXON_ID=43686 ORGANISM="Pelagodinium beii, Strain RCC1491" /NCGR_SAMPLE_ID=MMETSP1338 /ASSEMBLY_ACC=CAM_ASM_000754 /LENGTH=775 /DNA_ID=CAMNT_0043207823 /DNA_START=39 /DNA_END=2366 /DNA_ORIENTATION=-